MRTPSAELWELPPQLRSLIEQELNDAERIIWAGSPIPRRFAMRAIPIVLFGLAWTAFAVFWMAGASGFQMPDFKQGFDLFPLFGLPFFFIGLGMLGSPYTMMRKAKKTAYVLTTDRAIIFDGGYSTTIRSFYPERLTDLFRKQGSDGSGDLIFERKHLHDSDAERQATDHGFLAVADIETVEDMVRQLVDMSPKSKEKRQVV